MSFNGLKNLPNSKYIIIDTQFESEIQLEYPVGYGALYTRIIKEYVARHSPLAANIARMIIYWANSPSVNIKDITDFVAYVNTNSPNLITEPLIDCICRHMEPLTKGRFVYDKK